MARVYPRVCGGTHLSTIYPRALAGLSPRMRGNRQRAGQAVVGVRSIPAYAGEPVHGDDQPGADEVYPRVCGGTGYRI